MINRFQRHRLSGGGRIHATRKRESLKRFLRCEPLEDRRLLAAIFGYKFADANANGIDDSESRVNGVTVQLFQNGTLFQNAITADFDGNGDAVIDPATERGVFRFENLAVGSPTPFQYEVREVVPLGMRQTTVNPTAIEFASDNIAIVAPGQESFTAIPTQTESRLAFGNALTSSIHGFKFEDSDGDGQRDNGEPPMSGVPFRLTGIDLDGNNINLITNSDALGQFTFDNLLSSVDGVGDQTGYTVTEILPLGFESSTDSPSTTFDLDAGIELVWQVGAAMLGLGDPRTERLAADDGNQLVFGNAARGSIHGFKFDDVNANGIRDAGEPPLPGVTFTLTGIDGSSSSVNVQDTTDVNGEFAFVNLWPSASYTIAETLPPGHVETTPRVRTLPLTSGQELVWQIGAAMLPAPPTVAVDQSQLESGGGSITNTVFGQTFTPAVTGQLSFVSIGSVTAAAAGMTLEIQTLTSDPVPLPSGNILAAAGTPQSAGGNLIFNFTTPPQLVSGTRYAFVLRSSQPVTATTATGNLYVPGSRLTFDSVAGWQAIANSDLTFTTSMIGPADPRVEVLAGGNGVSLRFGNIVGSSIHGFKFIDIDGDGVRDAGESPMPGVTFRLSGTNALGTAVDLQTITDANGEFRFENLLPSVVGLGLQTGYNLTEELTTGYTSTTGGITRIISLAVGTELVWQPGAAMLEPGDPRTEVLAADNGNQLVFGNTAFGSIHGYKFNDVNGNGIPDAAEQPASGVTFTLTGTDGLGNPVNRTSITDVNGDFSFTLLRPSSSYTVTETVPSGFIHTTPIVRSFELTSGQELVWEPEAADLPPAPVAAVDQQQLLSNVSDSGEVFGQTFIPGVTGQLTRVSLAAASTNLVGVTLEVQSLASVITQQGVLQLPAGDILGQTSASSAVGDRLIFDFAAPPNLIAGDRYALVLRSTSQPGSWNYFAGNVYAAGSRLIFNDAGAWEIDQATDRTFETTMIAVADPRVEVLAGETGIPLVFGNRITSSIHGLKFEDIDGDGIRDASEPPMPNVPFTLTGMDASGTPVELTAVTDASGRFAFNNLLPSIGGQGTQTGYTVTEVVPSGFTATTGVFARSFDLAEGVELVWQDGEAMLGVGDPRTETNVGTELVFGNTASVSIHGFKFEDVNGNGIYDPDFDLPQPNVTFTLTGTDGQGNVVNREATTDDNGEFWFVGDELPLLPSVAGQGSGTGYTVTETIPLGFSSTTASIRTFDLESRQELVWRDGAAMLPDPPLPVVDQSQTQSNDKISTNLSMVGLQTFVPNLTGGLSRVDIQATTTGTPGDMILEVRPVDSLGRVSSQILGTATIAAANVPIGAAQSLTFDFVTAANLVAGVPFALVLSSPTTNTIGNSVSWDISTLNSYPNGNAGQANVGDFPTLPDLPNSDFVFTTFMQPAADPRQEVLTGDELMFGNTVAGSIHGFKFEDVNGNGVYEPGLGESGLAGVTFTLSGIDALDRVVNRTTTTGVGGEFEFVGLHPSSSAGYLVSETLPTGLVATTPSSRTFLLDSRSEFVWQFGAADLDAADPRREILATMDQSSNVGDELIFGNLIPGSIHGIKFLDIDGDGIFDEGTEMGLANIPFRLTGVDSSGASIDITVQSGADGQYDFVNLLPSVAGQPTSVGGLVQTGYTVTELVPVNFSATTPITFFTNVRSGEEYVARPGQSTPVIGPRLDQFQATTNTELSGNDLQYPAQTFVPTVDGPLAAISIEFSSLSMPLPVSDILVEIQTVSTVTGAPTGTALASAAVSPTTVGVGSPTRFDFAAPPTLTTGVSYAIVVRSQSNTTTFSLAANNLNLYSTGTALTTANDGATWDVVAGNDLVFATFMTQRINVEEVVGNPLVIGNTILGSLHGFKYEDIDGNRSYDPEFDSPLAGVTFVLTGTLADGTAIVQQANTDVNGEFAFTDLPPNVAGNGLATGYLLTEVISTGFAATTNTESFFDLTAGQEIVYAAGASDVDPQDPNDRRTEIVDQEGRLIFGNTVPGSIHGFKFLDFNTNGVYEPNLGEDPQANVAFTLTGIDAQGLTIEETQFTDETGQVWFTDLWPSIDGRPTNVAGVNATGYTLTEIVPLGFTSTTPPLVRRFDLSSRDELVWAPGAAMLAPAPVPVVDQIQNQSEFSLDVSDSSVAAQTFTSGVSGSLTSVQIQVTTMGAVGAAVLDVQTVNTMGQPTGFVIATATIPSASIPIGNNQSVTFNFTVAPASLTANQRYALVLRSPTTSGEGNQISWNASRSNPYFNGSAAQGTVDTYPLELIPTVDLVFSTTMLAAADPRTEVLLDRELIWGNSLGSSLHGFKYEDLNGNRTRDAGEPPLAGVWFQLTGTNIQGAVVDLVAITNDQGEFWFSGLLPSVIGQGQQTGYTITELVPTGFQSTTGRTSGPHSVATGEELAWREGAAMLGEDDPRTEVVVGNELIFGNVAPGSIHGFKFYDIDGDGIRDEGEPPAPGVLFMLTGIDARGNQVNRTETTNEGGAFGFTDLWPSTAYTVMEVVPRGYINTTPVARTFELQSREEFVWREGAAMLPPPPVAAVDQWQNETTSFASVDSTKVEAQTFTPMVTGRLSSIDITVRTTAAPGNVTLSVYDVTETGIVQTPIAVGDLLGQATILGGAIPPAQQQTLNFNFLSPPNLLAGRQYAIVLRAPNAAADAIAWGLSNENYAGGARLTATAPLGSLLTDPIQVTVGVPPQDHTFKTYMIAQADPRHEVLADGDYNGTGEELIFGNTLTGSIHGFKFLDIDADGIYSPANGDVPQAGVTFLLTGIGRGNLPINTLAVTDASGQFWFEDLPPSVQGQGKESGYTVTELVPNGFLPTTELVQRLYNLQSGIELAWQTGAAMLNPQLDPQIESVIGQRLMFGNASQGSIHGFKFLDIDGDGAYEPELGERPQAGVRFRLTGTDANGDQISLSTLTDEFGEFWFENLWPSVVGRGPATGYTLREIVPNGFVPTTLSERHLNVSSGQELVWRFGAAMLPNPPVATVDQQSVVSDSVTEVFGGMLGQTFTPFVTGGLSRVAIESSGAPSPAMILEVQSLAPRITSTGTIFVPSGEVLGTGTATESTNGSLMFDFASPPQLIAGLEYALVLRSAALQTLQWAFSSTDSYPQGVRLTFSDAQAWQRLANQDHAFITTMIPVADPRFEVLADSDDDEIGDQLIFGNRTGATEIRWRKETKTGLLGGVTFELTQTHAFSQHTGTFTDIVDKVTIVTDNLPPDGNPIFGLFAVTGIPFGRYTLRETVPVPGYDRDPFVQTLEITNFDPNQDSLHVFVNTWAKRAFISSTMLLRQNYLNQIGLTEPSFDDANFTTATTSTIQSSLSEHSWPTVVVTQTTIPAVPRSPSPEIQQVVTPSPLIQFTSITPMTNVAEIENLKTPEATPSTLAMPTTLAAVSTNAQSYVAPITDSESFKLGTSPATAVSPSVTLLETDTTSTPPKLQPPLSRRGLVASFRSNLASSIIARPAPVRLAPVVTAEPVVTNFVIFASVVESPKTTVQSIESSESTGLLRRILSSSGSHAQNAAAVDQVISDVANEIATAIPVISNPGGHSGQQSVPSSFRRFASSSSDRTDDQEQTLDLLYGSLGTSMF